jgi:hypothetical protein
MTIPTDKFFDYLNVPDRLWKEYELYMLMSPEQQEHVNRMGAKLWARTELTPAGAFELTMKLLDWVETVETEEQV